MSDSKVRLRFAPSPTGPLHMGGVRTALYNYLFAKKHGGDFILRIEDTDQNRYVPGAEEYIIEALKWSGIEPNEGIGFGGGPHAPYRQSERKAIYRKFAEQLVESGHAYYAFDTAESLDAKRKEAEQKGTSFFYNSITRANLVNSVSMDAAQTEKMLATETPHVIRLKVPSGETISFNDFIRGAVSFNSDTVDDKVLLKGDGMPTYHLAHIVDDYLMGITHAVRGEEWLPSAPAHILIYRYLGWEQNMPQYAHLPLLLKPDGNGKLSKRDGDRLGFPVFPLQWSDPHTGETSSGYRERNYYPEAFINMLALLGWNPGTEQEIFTMPELIELFSFEHVHKAGARFDPEKAKWFNSQYLRMRTDKELAIEFIPAVISHLDESHSLRQNKTLLENYITEVCSLVKDKANFVNEFWSLSYYLFQKPQSYDEQIVIKKWNKEIAVAILKIADELEKTDRDVFTTEFIQQTITGVCSGLNLKPGTVMQPLRLCISGLGAGVDLLRMMVLLGKSECIERMRQAVNVIEAMHVAKNLK